MRQHVVRRPLEPLDEMLDALHPIATYKAVALSKAACGPLATPEHVDKILPAVV